MFGRVEFVMKASPGAGIVSSAVLQSDDLDEIDWEWLGGDNAQVQSNYFGKGQTTTYNRGAFHASPNNQGAFHTYTIEWTSDHVVWQIDGVTIRTLEPSNAQGQYPQTPMRIKIGTWAGGDPTVNAPGTVRKYYITFLQASLWLTVNACRMGRRSYELRGWAIRYAGQVHRSDRLFDRHIVSVF